MKHSHFGGRLRQLLQQMFRRPLDKQKDSSVVLGGSRPTQEPNGGNWNPTHRHAKGGAYRVLMHAILEADRSAVVVYDDIEGTVWVRALSEFCDGRFSTIEGVDFRLLDP